MLLKGLIVEGDLAPRAGVEPATSPLGGVRSIQLSYRGIENLCNVGGAEEDRTPDLVIANDALSQLSYGPIELCDCRNI